MPIGKYSLNESSELLLAFFGYLCKKKLNVSEDITRFGIRIAIIGLNQTAGRRVPNSDAQIHLRCHVRPRQIKRRTVMTNYEANNSSSAPRTTVKSTSWAWLSDRLQPQGLEKLDSWISKDLEQLEIAMAHMVSARSLKRDQRYQFSNSQR